jgi:tetratricopeptide (TPR) repeat protein
MVRMKHCLVVAAIFLSAWSAGGWTLEGAIIPARSDEALPLNNFPPPPLMQGIGDATLTITTKSSQAQAYFNQGLRLLHDFWYFEAYRAFKEAARLDPSAAMAYWGMAQALSNFPQMGEKAAAAIEKAKSLIGQVTGQEQHYIRATAALTENPGDRGRNVYVQEMQALLRENPGDLNAPAFLAFFVMSGFDPDGRPTPGEVYAQSLLRRILAKHPENVAANHYWIHAVEGGPNPESGLASVAVILRGAPHAGHIVHMGGHVAYCLGNYEQARKSFLDSLRVDEAYLAKEHIPAQYDDNYAHNLSYLVTACAEAGRRQEALRWAQKLDGLPSPLVYAASALNYAIPVGSTLLRMHLRFADFSAATQDTVDFGVVSAGVDSAAKEYQQGLQLYAQAMAFVTGGSTDAGMKQAQDNADKLQRLVSTLAGQASQALPMISGMPSPMSGMVSFWTGGAARLLEISSVELQGELACAKGDSASGFALLKDAVQKERELGYTEPPYYARPVEESLADAYRRAHAWELAREAFQQELRLRPKSGFALYGIARSYELQGRVEEATQGYRQFLAAWQHADPDLPQIRTAKEWLAKRTGVH